MRQEVWLSGPIFSAVHAVFYMGNVPGFSCCGSLFIPKLIKSAFKLVSIFLSPGSITEKVHLMLMKLGKQKSVRQFFIGNRQISYI